MRVKLFTVIILMVLTNLNVQAAILDTDAHFLWLESHPIRNMPMHVLGFNTHGVHPDIDGKPVVKVWKLPRARMIADPFHISIKKPSALVRVWTVSSESSAAQTLKDPVMNQDSFDDFFDDDILIPCSDTTFPISSGIFSWFESFLG